MPIEKTTSRVEVPVDDHDEFTFPWNIFDTLQDSSAVAWTCVRARPRWEKKLCRLLRFRMVPHYMPVVSRQTYSGRKLRSSSLPLFPGFVFVKGSYTKGSFKDTGCVASVLSPASQKGIEALDSQLRAVRRMLALGRPVSLTTEYEIGEKLSIDSGPLCGISGTVISTANAKRLVLWVDMLGVGAAVELDCDTILARSGIVQVRDFQPCLVGSTG